MQRPEMSMGMDMQMRAHQEISRKTPVLDNLEGVGPFFEGILDSIVAGQDVDIIVFGESGIGKGAVSEQLFQKLVSEKSLSTAPIGRRSKKTHFSAKYYNLAMGISEASHIPGLLSSSWGEYTPPEREQIAHLMRARLEATEHDFPSPFVRVIEVVGIEAAQNMGVDVFYYGADRRRRDPNYQYFAIGLLTDPLVQEGAIRLREGIWRAQSGSEIREVFKRAKVRPDISIINSDVLRRRMGTVNSILRIRADVNNQILTLGEKLKEFDPDLPMLSEEQLDTNPSLRQQALAALYAYKLQEWGIDQSQVLLTTNLRLRRTIPYYSSLLSSPNNRLYVEPLVIE